MNTHEHAPRPKFDTLFADPRHYRGDLRLMRTAIRRGWLDDAPPADREALLVRFRAAMAARRATDPDTRDARAALAECETILAALGTPLGTAARLLRYAWAGEPTDRTTGRPRERWHVSDYSNRLDANELRRRAKAEGTDLRTLVGGAIEVRPADRPDDPGVRIALAVVADARYGWRVWLVCPGCKCRRVHLYPVRAGWKCRRCAGIAYAERKQCHNNG